MSRLKTVLPILLLCIHPCIHAANDKGKECPPDERKDCAVKKTVPRRAVPQTIERVPPVAPAARTGVPVVVPPMQAPAPPPAVTACDAGGCLDSGGSRYSGGANGTYTNGSGRLCLRNGTSMQCF